MRRLIEKDKRNAERICPFIGYAEVADDPNHAITATPSISSIVRLAEISTLSRGSV
jgi:hypothetical protein